MSFKPKRHIGRPPSAMKRMLHSVLGGSTVAILRLQRFANRKKAANFIGGFLRRVGPWLPEHRIGRANLAAAFPEKSAEEIERILVGVWDNLGRVAGEFAQIDRMTIAGPASPEGMDIAYDAVTVGRIDEIISTKRPRLFFAAHLANWELPAMIAHHLKIDASILYRPPNIRAASDAILKIRAGCMGTLVPSGFDAPIRLARALENGTHAGMLVDQHDIRGVDVTFFGRPCKASPLLGQLARHFDCPIHGLRVVRQPDGNSFWGEVTEPVAVPRDAEGLIDVRGTMQAVTAVVEAWVREHHDQWLWLHRRWR